MPTSDLFTDLTRCVCLVSQARLFRSSSKNTHHVQQNSSNIKSHPSSKPHYQGNSKKRKPQQHSEAQDLCR